MDFPAPEITEDILLKLIQVKEEEAEGQTTVSQSCPLATMSYCYLKTIVDGPKAAVWSSWYKHVCTH